MFTIKQCHLKLRVYRDINARTNPSTVLSDKGNEAWRPLYNLQLDVWHKLGALGIDHTFRAAKDASDLLAELGVRPK